MAKFGRWEYGKRRSPREYAEGIDARSRELSEDYPRPRQLRRIREVRKIATDFEEQLVREGVVETVDDEEGDD